MRQQESPNDRYGISTTNQLESRTHPLSFVSGQYSASGEVWSVTPNLAYSVSLPDRRCAERGRTQTILSRSHRLGLLETRGTAGKRDYRITAAGRAAIARRARAA